MGRRLGGGGSNLRSNLDRTLLRDIESAPKKYNASVEQLVDHLRSSHPHYARHKLQPFTKRVEKIIQFSRKRKNSRDDDDDDDPPTTKRQRKIDEKEEKLQIIMNVDTPNSSGGCSSSSLAFASSWDEEESSKEEGSTSEDAIHGEKFEPEFDLMKSLLRDHLGRKHKDLVNEEDKLDDNQSKINDKNDNGVKDVDRGNGPMFKDLGGMGGVIEELKMKVLVRFCHPEIPRHLGGKSSVPGILLHGPPGCGKTTLAQAIANETGVPFYQISATELVSGVSGASEENIRELFSKAYRTAPSIVFIDEIDAIASKRENLQREMDRRIVTHLMTCMDESHRQLKPEDDKDVSKISDCRPSSVLVIGATNRPDAIDPALRRSGRFGLEIFVGVPDEHGRTEILKKLTSNLKVEGSLDLARIARSTPGFVGADLTDLVDEAVNLAVKRIMDTRKIEFSKALVGKYDSEDWWRLPWSQEEIEKLEKLGITMADFEEAAKTVQPSSRREGFSAIPDENWDSVGGLHCLRQEFDFHIVKRIKSPEDYEYYGADLETGFLLYGPPGCGKTLIAKAVANEAGANFIYIQGPELLNKYVGESEKAVRTLFSRARTCSPCIIFFDEVDALTTKRGNEGGKVQLLNQLLVELDGSKQRRGVYVIGATNRPEAVDPSLLRPGRFGKLMYVPLPSPDERGLILKTLGRDKPIDKHMDLIAFAKDIACENFSGADLRALMYEAAAAAVKDEHNSSRSINETHFRIALEKTKPSVSAQQRRHHKRLSKRFNAAA